MRRWLAWLLVSTLLVPGLAEAHEYWLSPSRYRAAAGDTNASWAVDTGR